MFEVMSEELAANTPLSIELASRLRTWSLAPELFDDLAGNQGRALGRLTKLLSKIDPSPATITWLTRIVGVGSQARLSVLFELPELVRMLVARDGAVDDVALRRIYQIAAGVRDDAGRIREDVSVPRDAMTGNARIMVLVDHRKTIGLISSRPSAFVTVAIDLIAGHEADYVDEQKKLHCESKARAAAAIDSMASHKTDDTDGLPTNAEGFFDLPEEVKAAEAKAKAIAGDELLEENAGGALIVNNPTDRYWNRDMGADYAPLLLHLRNLAEKSLAEDSAFFDDYFWPSVKRSRSALARACVLDLLTRQKLCPREAILDELLHDARLYFLPCARRYLQLGIQMRWASLNQNDRQRVLENIRNCGRAPARNVEWPGPLLSAIPEEDWPTGWNAFVELYRIRGWELDPDRVWLPTVISGGHSPESNHAWVAIGGLSSAQQKPWQHLAEWTLGRIRQATDSEWSALVEHVETLIAHCLPAPKDLLNHVNLIERLNEFCAVHKDADQRTSRLTSEALRNLARWSVGALRAFPARDITGDCEPFDETCVGLPPNADLWINLVYLADAVLHEGELKDAENLNTDLFSAIDDIAKDSCLARHLLGVRGWFRTKCGKSVLWALLTERVRDSHALSNGLRFLEEFDRCERHMLIRTWLTSELSPAISPPRDFARYAGWYLGKTALRLDEGSRQRTWDFNVIRELVAAPAQSGILGDPSVHALFVGQSVFGAKEALDNGDIPLARANEYAGLMRECWKALRPSLDESKQKDVAFALWAFSPILDAKNESSPGLKLTPKDRLTWWNALKPLAISIVQAGPSREIDSLFHCLARSPLTASLDTPIIANLLDLLEALRARTASLTLESAGYYWLKAISRAANVIESITANTKDTMSHDQLYALVSTWAAPPLAVENAGAVAKRLREY
jgi:hypothetical protein